MVENDLEKSRPLICRHRLTLMCPCSSCWLSPGQGSLFFFFLMVNTFASGITLSQASYDIVGVMSSLTPIDPLSVGSQGER